MVVERDKNGSPLRMAGTHIDISRLKKVELELMLRNDELRVAREEAEESDRLKSAFLANMSHEIRTPMNGIIGFSEMMKNPDLFPKQEKLREIIIDSSLQLLSIVNDILDISRIETAQVTLTHEPVVVNDLISILFAFFEPQAVVKNITLQTTKDLSNQESTIMSDRTRLRQVITNLLNNAMKFTSEGYVHFGYKLKDDVLQFFVEDTGIGIPDDMHEKIFEPFRQVELEMTSKFGGTAWSVFHLPKTG
jgi:signal transduction histidine kinase